MVSRRRLARVWRAVARARKLHIIAAGLVGAMPAAPDTSTARGCVAAAMMLCPGRKPPSVHTLYRIACMTL